MKERLQKVLARAGHGSRRACETLITGGRVAVNGSVATDLGVKADPAEDRIEVDGTLITLPTQHVYIALHKPLGVVTTAHDEQGRVTVLDLVKSDVRVFPVGRLDRDSEGLLILTNDGELAARLTHPRFGLEKEYFVRVPQPPAPDVIQSLARGIELEGQLTSPARIDLAAPPPIMGSRHGDHWIRVVIHEGKNRQIRRMLASVGIPTRRLVRTRIGPLHIGRLKGGESRPLTLSEVESLQLATALGTHAQPQTNGQRPDQSQRKVTVRHHDSRAKVNPSRRRIGH